MLYFLLLISFTIAGEVTITNTDSDTYFCGYKWDDPGCKARQHCPSGRNELCEGFADGVKCFANTNCDTKFGDGVDFVSGIPPPPPPPPGTAPATVPRTPRPTYTGKSDDPTDHYWCGVGLDDARNKCIQHCPGGTSAECPQGHICYWEVMTCDARNIPPETLPPAPGETDSPSKAPFSGPTKIPTYMPIPPPDPLPFPSDDPTDHWFCGVGINDANEKCRVHCPTANECPMGQICYFGTQCDGRTFSPTPPPTRRPTKNPTAFPTSRPTHSMPPSVSPSATMGPSASPTEQVPTKSPTPSPTKRPTYAPMPSLQAGFFCGTDWNDVIHNCRRRCPSGEDPECPDGEFCFAQTPCKEEKGYPEGYFGSDEGDDGEDKGGHACVPFEVTITADAWPAETTWEVKDLEMEEIIAEGTNDNLESGKAVDVLECINYKQGCYAFTIKDSGGDGLCCEHGDGSYEVKYDGVEVKKGAAFYDFETTEFGLCGATEAPTAKPVESPPTNASKPDGSATNSEGMAYRCVANALADKGYVIAEDKCELFDNCYNEQIKVGDDWFCSSNASCIEAPACSILVESNNATPPASDVVVPNPTPKPATKAPTKATSPPTKVSVPGRPVASRPVATTTEESIVPTHISATSSPTIGPCTGERCNQSGHCRSPYGFCGPGATYCNEIAIWTEDCSTPQPSQGNTPVSSSLSPTIEESLPPSIQKLAWSKPGGGKGSAPKPARTHSPTSAYPIREEVSEANPLEPPSPSPLSLEITPSPSQSPETIQMATEPPTYLESTPVSSESPVEDPDSSDVAIDDSKNDSSCSGERCPVDTHCRSRYGSCGPGFIYCNAYSIWQITCPPPTPGVTPTRSPSSKPKSSSTSPTKPIRPTFPPIPQPTLAHISELKPFSPPKTELEDGLATADSAEDADAGKEGKVEQNTAPSQPENTFQSAAYLDMWAGEGFNGSSHRMLSTLSLSITAVVIALVA